MEEQETKVKTTLTRAERSCQVKGCKRPYRAKGYCNVHYKQWRKGLLPKTRIKQAGKKKKEE